MEKIKISVVLLLAFLGLSYFLPVNAQYFNSNWSFNENMSPIVEGKEVNILSAVNENFYVTEESSIDDIYYAKDEEQVSNGILKFRATMIGSLNHTIYIDSDFEFDSNGYLCNFKYYIDRICFFDCDVVDGNDEAKIKSIKEIDLTEYYHTYETFHYVGAECTDSTGDANCVFDNEFINRVFFGFLYGLRYEYNSQYSNKDLYVITKNDNPLSYETIIDSFNVYDETDGNLSNEYLEVLSSNYVVSDNYIKPATYTINLMAFDKARNVVKQKVLVYVRDVIAPKISTTQETLELTTENDLNKESFIKYFTATDDTGEVDISITNENYTKSPKVAGTYEVTACASDKAGNKAYATLNVTVKDYTKPKIVFNEGKALYVTTLKPITLEEIKAMCEVSDNVTNLTTNDLYIKHGDYFDNPQRLGTHVLTIYAKDEAGNEGFCRIELIVVDEDYPKINGGKYSLSVDKGVSLSKTDVLNLLVSSGQLTQDEIVNLSSTYFVTENPNGTYLLSIELADGSEIVTSLNVIENNASYDYNNPTKEVNNNTVMIIIIASSLSAILIIGLGIIIYKKKH